MDLGQSFSPANQQQADPNVARRKRTPVQQALQTVSLQLPTATGGAADLGPGGQMGGAPNAVAADLLSGRSGSVARQSASQPRTQALLNAMMASGGQNTQGVTARGGGFSGGGFGDLGKFKPPSVESLPGAPTGGGGGTMGGGLGDLISKLPGLSPGGGMPGLPTPPSAGARPSVPGIPPIPPSLRPPVVAKPPVVPPTVSLPPINPNIPGGGAVDFNRGSDPRFNTPTGQAPPTNGGITGGMNPTPAPAPAPVAPAPVAPPTSAPPASGAPPQYGGASGATFKPMPPGMGPGVPGYATWYAAGYR